MRPSITSPRPSARCLPRARTLAVLMALAFVAALVPSAPASALAVGSVSISGANSADVNTNIPFTISYACSGDDPCTNVSISVSFSVMNSAGATNFSIGTIQPGSTGQVFTAGKFPSNTANGTTGSISVTMNVANGNNGSASHSVTANNPNPPTTTTTSTSTTIGATTTTTTALATTTTTIGGGGGGTTTTSTTTTAPPSANYGVDVGRSTSEVALGEEITWTLRSWSSGNLDLTGHGWTFTPPEETIVTAFYTGGWNPTSTEAYFEYRVAGVWIEIGTFRGNDMAWFNLPPLTDAIRAEFNGGGALSPGFNVGDAHRVRTEASRPGRGGVWFNAPRPTQGCGSFTSDNAGNRGDCAGTTVVVPAARPAPDIWIETGGLKPTSDVSLRVRVANRWNAQLPLIDPFIAFHMPAELEFVGWEYLSGGTAPPLTIVEDYGAIGRTLLRWDYDETFIAGDSRDFRVFAKVARGVPVGSHPAQVMSTTNDTTHLIECATTPLADNGDVDQDGNAAELVCSDTANFYVEEAAITEAVMYVRGESDLDPLDWSTLEPPSTPCPDEDGYTFYPCVAQTKSLGQTDYRLEVYNAGNVELTDFTLYNTLPFVGDNGVTPVLSGFARGSEWRPSLQSPLTIVDAPQGVVVEYSVETNPCRNEIGPGGNWPSGCIDDWGPPPPDLRLVQAIRIRGDFPAGQRWEGGEPIIVEYDMDASQGSPFGGEIGWTSFGYNAERADTGLELPASEPRKTGMAIKAPDNGIGTTVWLDADRDGIREAGEPGINGVRVELYREDGTLEAVTYSDDLRGDTSQPGFYFFGDRDPGRYYVQFELPRPGWNIMLPDQGNDDTVDSDASILTARTPIIDLGANDFQLNWDLAYFVPLGPLECDADGAEIDPLDDLSDRRQVNDRLPCPN